MPAVVRSQITQRGSLHPGDGCAGSSHSHSMPPAWQTKLSESCRQKPSPCGTLDASHACTQHMQQPYGSYLWTLQKESSCRCNSWLRRLCVLNAPISSFIVLMMYLQHPQFRPRCTCVSQQQGYMTSSNLCTRNQGHKRRHPVQLCIVSTTVRRDARTCLLYTSPSPRD